MNRSSRKTNVYYLPVGLTNFQRDLIEILISLHANSFEKEIRAITDDENTPDVESTSMYPKLSNKKMTYMFDHNVRAVANHPCLLVDHYMPRQFLRMEPNEKLINSSDKFQKLQELLYHLIHRDRKKYPDVLKIALISHSVRELDLLEGLVLGEMVRMKRLSGTSVYDEKHVYFEESADRSQDNSDSKDCTPGIESSSNSYTGYPRDDYDYSSKRLLRSAKPIPEDWLFLTTTTHLINDPTLLKDYHCDYIISFDPLLDPGLQALAPLNIKANKRIPIIKMLVVDSPDHYILANMQAGEQDQYQLLKESIDYFLHSRHFSKSNEASTNQIDFSELVHLLLSGEPLTTGLKDINLSGVGEDPEPYQPKLSKLKNSNSSLSINTTVLDMKSYQSELMKRTVDRLTEIQNECENNSNLLRIKRLRETERQNHLDDLKHEIGLKFKKLEDDKRMKMDSEKRLERSGTENDKLTRRHVLLQEKRAKLEKLLQIDDDAEISSIIDQYKADTQGMKIEVEHLQEENDEKMKQNEILRAEYQQKSSNAVEVAQKLSSLKTAVQQSEKDLSGPAADLELRSWVAKENELIDEQKLIKDKVKFLKAYINKMTSHYGLKLSANGESYPNPSISNSRSSALHSRHKSTRSNTPTYT